MPLLFVGHGSPMNAIDENQFVSGFRSIAKTLPEPKAILCISAHWLTGGTLVTGMEYPRTIHDFGRFPDELYQIEYPAKGSPELATVTRKYIGDDLVELDQKWGLDHGAWTVLRHLYPEADIPVVQLSLDYHKPASWHFELAGRLKDLRERGILIIGSGNIIHNLNLIDFNGFDRDNYGFDWAVEARNKINSLIAANEYSALIEYKKLGREIQLAIPTPDHYLPLIYILALADKREEKYFFNDKLLAGSLSMTSLKIS